MQTLTKRILALLLVCVLALGAAPAALASDEALTRGEVRDLLLAAADDYSEAEAGDVLTGGREDETATELAREALDAMGVALVDHIIVADNDYVSLRESGRIRA